MATGYVRVQLLACVFSCATSSQCCHRPLAPLWGCSPNMTSVETTAVALLLCVEVIKHFSVRTHWFISLEWMIQTLPWQCYLLLLHWVNYTTLGPLCLFLWTAGNILILHVSVCISGSCRLFTTLFSSFVFFIIYKVDDTSVINKKL